MVLDLLHGLCIVARVRRNRMSTLASSIGTAKNTTRGASAQLLEPGFWRSSMVVFPADSGHSANSAFSG